MLADNVIHVWKASLDLSPDTLAHLRASLADDEQARAARFRFDKDRNHYVATRGILRDLLGRCLGRRPNAVQFRYTAYGKPELDAPDGLNTVRFNVSHSGGLALLAFTLGRPVGIDVEAHHDRVTCNQIAERYFTPGEAATLRALPEERHQAGFFACWVRKEAVIKAVGEGLSFGLDHFDVGAEPEPGTTTIELPGAQTAWTVTDLALGPGYSGAVAVEGTGMSVHCRVWEAEPWLPKKHTASAVENKHSVGSDRSV